MSTIEAKGDQDSLIKYLKMLLSNASVNEYPKDLEAKIENLNGLYVVDVGYEKNFNGKEDSEDSASFVE